DIGTPIGGGGHPAARGASGAGGEPAEHPPGGEITIDELADIMGGGPGRPPIEPEGADPPPGRRRRYAGIKRAGPSSLRSFRRTYKEALKRELASGTYNPLRPVVVSVRDDMRYRSWREEPKPVANAAIIYMMDVSGSMGDEQKE